MVLSGRLQRDNAGSAGSQWTQDGSAGCYILCPCVCAVRPRSGEMAVGLTSRSAGLGSRVGRPDSRTGRPDRRPQLVLRSATDRLIDWIAADLRLTTRRW